MKSFLSFILTLAALAVVKTGTPEVSGMEIVAGSEVNIPCNLKGPKLTWYWIPSYPRCADIKGHEKEKAIFLVTPNGGHRVLMRFELRSGMKGERANGSAILILRDLYMNDSGTFYCSNGNMDSPNILITVKPGDQNGIIAEYFMMPHYKYQRVDLTCNSCENKTQAQADDDDTTDWTLNGRPVSKDIIIQKLRNVIQIKMKPRKSSGLWQCNDPACPTQSDGYCLESVPGTSEKSGDEETALFTPTPPGMAGVGSDVIGGASVGVLLLLLVGVVVFVTCRRHRSRTLSPSETANEPETQESGHPTVPEGSPKRRNKEEARTADHTSTKGGAEEIQYSTLEFMETGRHQIQMDKETVVYAEMPANN